MKNLKRLIPYLKQYKSRIYLGFLFVTLSNICSTYLPRVVGNSIDLIQSKQYTMTNIYYSIAEIMLLTVGSGLFMFLTRQTIIVMSRLIEYDLRRDYLTALELQSANFFNATPTGRLMSYATNDIPAVREFIGPAIMYAANTLTTFSFALYYMLSLNVTMTWVALLPLPLITVSTYFIGKKVHIHFTSVQEQFSKLTTQAQETFSGIRVVRAYVREHYESIRFGEQSKFYADKNMKLAKYQSLFMPLLMVLVGLTQIIVLGFGGYLVINHKVTLGGLSQFFIYINLLIWPVAAIGWVTNLVQRASASAARLGVILDAKPEIIDNEKTNHDINEIHGAISINNLNFRYAEDLPYVLQNINIDVKEGTSLGIIGTVGSGKSTIANLIPRLYEAPEGTIRIDGHDIREIPLATLRHNIGMVTQDTFLFTATIEENIRFGKSSATREEVEYAARIAEVEEDIKTFPNGYETLLGERGITLSGGQKQRVSLARAVVKNPPILILDDSLSAVDTQTESRILQSLRQFMKGRTTIIISHRTSAIKELDHIIVLDKGEIIERGTHNELIAMGGRYSLIHSRQQLEEELEKIE
jgi:ATP-binding cassette subfamily B multidrug efflux pump